MKSSKRLLHGLASLLIIFGLVIPVSSGIVKADAAIEIWDWYDLDAIRHNLSASYVLMRNLDSATAGYEALAGPEAYHGKGWEPIGTWDEPFTGTFDGRGYEIVGLSANRPDRSAVGLFGWVGGGGLVKNTGIVDAEMTGMHHVGALMGGNYGAVSNSYSTGSVTGEGAAGGLVGGNYGSVSDSYFTGSVTGDWNVGGLVGWNYGAVSNSHYDYDKVIINEHNIITIGALFAEDFQQWLANDKSLDVDKRLSRDDGYYVINNVSDFKQLLAFGQDSSLRFRLENDLDLAAEPDFYVPYLAGRFDGDGRTVSNLSFSFDFVSNVGLFGCLAPGGEVRGLGVESVNIAGRRPVGGLVGINRGHVSNCYSTGNVTGGGEVGGLVGGNYGTVSNSCSSGSVSGVSWVGGLVGINGGTVTNSYSGGSVIGESYAGGLVGFNTGTVTNSYSTGSITGVANVGGLVGENYKGNVVNCFWDVETSGMTSSYGGTGKTTHEMMAIATYSDTATEGLDEQWDIVAVAPGHTNPSYTWNILDGLTCPFLSWRTPKIGLADSPWPKFRHDAQNTGRSPYTGPEVPQLKWSFLTGGFVRSSPAIGANGTIYVGSYDHRVYAINPEGTEKWSFATGGSVVSSPAVGTDETIYVGSDNRLYAINPDGTEKWSFLTGSDVGSSPAIGADGTIYVGSQEGKLYAVNLDGTEKWSFFMTGGVCVSSPAIGADGTIYVTSYVDSPDNLYAISPDGTERWRFPAGGESSPAIGADGTIYVGSDDHRLYAINPDGTEKWTFTTGDVRSSPAIGADGTIYVGSRDSRLYAINPDGTEKWSFITGPDIDIDSSPAIGADGTIYVGSNDHRLYAINPDGTEKWTFTTGSEIHSSPAIGADSTIYVGSCDGKLYAIGEAAVPPDAPIARASDIDSQPDPMHPNTPYTVTAKYFDPDGREDLKYCYLQLKHPDKPLTMMWVQATDDFWVWASEEGANYLTVSGTSTPISEGGLEGYELAWTFTINDQWPEVENAIDFGVYAWDDSDLKSGWEYDDTKASFILEGLVVTFPDENLEAAIREAIHKPSGDIYQSDLEAITYLYAPDRDIGVLTGLEYCTSLIELVLIDNRITDITPLGGLTELTFLWLQNNQIRNIEPLADLTGLNTLALTNNRIRDVSPLVANPGFSAGDWIDLRNNPLTYDTVHSDIPHLRGRGVLVLYDLPFAPAPHGYRFQNTDSIVFLTEEDKKTIFEETFDWSSSTDTYREALFNEYKDEIGSGGNCYGMAASSLMEYAYPGYVGILEDQDEEFLWDLDPSWVLPLNIWNAWNLQNKPVLKHILNFQLSQRGSVRGAQMEFDGDPMGMIHELEESDQHYMVLVAYWEVVGVTGNGHALVPYRIVEIGNTVRVYVYDSNYPSGGGGPAFDKYVEVCRDTNTWRYLFQDGEYWPPDGVPQSFLSLMPIEAHHYYDEDGTPKPGGEFVGGGSQEVVLASRNVSLTLIDLEGRKTGFRDGSYVAEIPGVTPIYYIGTSSTVWRPEYCIADYPILTAEIVGTSQGTYSLSRFGFDYFAGVNDVSISEGVVDSIALSADSARLSFYEYQDPKSYDLLLHIVEEDGGQTFSATGIPAMPGAVHEYIVDWDALALGEKGVTVQIDLDGDGEVDLTFTAGSELTADLFILHTETFIDFDPDVLSLRARGGLVTVYIELPEGFDVHDIDISTILLNGTVPALSRPTSVGDYNSNGIPDLMVKFDRRAVQATLEVGQSGEITITGEVDGIPFMGTDTIRVINW